MKGVIYMTIKELEEFVLNRANLINVYKNNRHKQEIYVYELERAAKDLRQAYRKAELSKKK